MLLVDPSKQAQTFLRYRDVNYLNYCSSKVSLLWRLLVNMLHLLVGAPTTESASGLTAPTADCRLPPPLLLLVEGHGRRLASAGTASH